ncbi:DUF87 domain-containing protein [Candidatus Woesearchaeota archaeon]|nr:DUF87 domain-containing protein [Candidatus Woesearchaeota archaeon]
MAKEGYQYKIVLGRSKSKLLKYDTRATVLLAKQYVQMLERSTASQPVYLDLDKAHVCFVCGKRGSGKSYTMGSIAEGIADSEVSENISVIIFDTMGIYWTMKYPNHKPDEERLLKEWGLEGKGFEQVKVYTPVGLYKEYRKKAKTRTDAPFSLRASELLPEDWILALDLSPGSSVAAFVERVILKLKDAYGDDPYGIDDILEYIKEQDENIDIKRQAITRFESADRWGLFSEEATPIRELAKGGQVTVIDLSAYAQVANGWKIKALTVGFVSLNLFKQRMSVRADEEYQTIESTMHYLLEEGVKTQSSKMPIVWMFLDEAHEFLPLEGKTGASDALITLLREGRQPGIAMVLATQQPGKIHTDAMTQSDILLAHRLTAKIDVEALGALMQSYLRKGLDMELKNLPSRPGAALVVDDENERMFPVQMRPRMSWHGGSAPGLLHEKKKGFD